jgi:hypothetical protein
VISLDGIFLRYEYFRPIKSLIRDEWLKAAALPEIVPGQLTIHIRTGDVYKSPGFTGRQSTEYHALPFSFYADIINERPWRDLRIVAASPDDPMVVKLAARFDATVLAGSEVDDFNALRSSSAIVLSVSTFAWWAAWLSHAQTIYYPLAGLFDPSRAVSRPFPWRQDLRVVDEERYVHKPTHGTDYDWTGSRDDQLRLLES